jgi:cyclopropane-fatty-acyl-phospholipid synthase
MNLRAKAIELYERAPLPDVVSRAAIAILVARTSRKMNVEDSETTRAFAAAMRARPIAIHTDAANAQHYEVPAEFFGLVLGPRRKYSCCLYPEPATSLAEAEEISLAETAAHADLEDGQTVLELGCGWGSLSLYAAERYPKSTILAVSNSRSQRAYIEAQAEARGLANLRVVTADVNAFDPGAKFDRIVSVEMFEHVSNWPELLGRVRNWLKPDGRFFMHVFSHARLPYRFDHTDPADWIAQHFFTGGIMPSHALIREFPDLFEVEAEWRWNGRNYERTALDWLANFDRNDDAVMRVLTATYGDAAELWKQRWRLFFLATAGLFGHGDGSEWAVSHYRLRPTRS